MPGRGGRAAASLPCAVGVVGAVLLVVALAWLLGRAAARPPGSTTASAGASASSPSGPRIPATPATGRYAALQQALDHRAAAVSTGDEQTWSAPLDPTVPGLLERQRDVLAALRTLPLGSLSYRVVGRSAAPAPAGQEAVDVLTEWSLTGYDGLPARQPLVLHVRPADGRWLITDDGAPGTVRQAFDLAGLRARRTSAGLVIGNGPADRLDACAATLAPALARAESAWRTAARPPVVVVPRTVAEFASLTSRRPEDVGDVAAITYGLLETGATARGDKVVINPAAWDRLTSRGREVVLAHELTHLLVRGSTTHPVPSWLSEGFAVRASYAGLAVDPRTAAPELAAAAARGQVPSDLPGEGDFRGHAADRAYDEAWLAVEHLVRVAGADRVRRFYELLGAGGTEEQAWRALGVSRARLVAGWQDDLRALG